MRPLLTSIARLTKHDDMDGIRLVLKEALKSVVPEKQIDETLLELFGEDKVKG